MGESINWKEEGAKSGGIDVIKEPCSVMVEITGWEECTSKNKGTPQIRWFATVQKPDGHATKKLCDHTPLSSAALWRVARLVKGCGIDLSEAPTTMLMSDAFKKMLDLCVGRKTWWVLTYDEQYQNNKVQDNIPVAPSEQDVVKVTAEMLGGGKDDPSCPF